MVVMVMVVLGWGSGRDRIGYCALVLRRWWCGGVWACDCGCGCGWDNMGGITHWFCDGSVAR